jgi:hypothetical protein
MTLAEEQKLDLVRLAARAWFEDLREMAFDWPGCSGVLRVASDTVALGSFVGQRFDADLHQESGSGKVQFLVAEGQLPRRHGPVAEA